MLHFLESEVDREEFATRLAGEFLYVAVAVVAYSPLNYACRLAVDTSRESDWLDYVCFNFVSYGLADLDCPNVLAHHISELEVWASTQPIAVLFHCHIVHSMTRLGGDFVESLCFSNNLVWFFCD